MRQSNNLSCKITIVQICGIELMCVSLVNVDSSTIRCLSVDHSGLESVSGSSSSDPSSISDSSPCSSMDLPGVLTLE